MLTLKQVAEKISDLCHENNIALCCVLHDGEGNASTHICDYTDDEAINILESEIANRRLQNTINEIIKN